MELETHGKLWAIAHLRCPRCHHGRVYHGIMSMHKKCSVCHLVYQREPGYFTGATLVGCMLCTGVAGIWVIVLFLLFPDWSDLYVHGLAIVLMALLIPLVMRYARVLWMTMDRAIDVSH